MDVRERGVAAARAYTERIGQTAVACEGSSMPGGADLLGIDGETLVGTIVYIVHSSEELPVTSEPALDATLEGIAAYRDDREPAYPNVRLDVISLLVIAEDRALLRHHRGVRGD